MIHDTLGTDPSALLHQFRQAVHLQHTSSSAPSAPPVPNPPPPSPSTRMPLPQVDTPHLDSTPHSELPTPHSKRGRPLVFDALKQHTFLRLVSVGFSLRRAARLVGVSPSTVREMAARNMVFASGYEDAKAQAIPALAENVYHAGQRSWRASAWLLERLRPSHFGRRVALGPDPAKHREDERLRQEKKKEQLDLQKPELNDQILIRCIHRLCTDQRARDIFEACADDFDRQAAEQAKAAGDKPQSSTNPVDDSNSAPPMETRCLSEEPAVPVRPPDQPAADDLAPHFEHAPPGQTPPPATIEARRVSEEHTPTDSAHSKRAQPTFCAPPPSANYSAPSTMDPTTETQAPHPQPPIARSPTPSNFCALTPPAPSAESPPAMCAETTSSEPNHLPPLSVLRPPPSVMMTFG